MTAANTLATNLAFIRAGMLPLDEVQKTNISSLETNVNLATILSNMAYYGVAPSRNAVEQLASLSAEQLAAFWENIEQSLANLTGADRNMDNHIVYKNFPEEVLEMDQCEYWMRQILIYIGVPQDLLRQDAADRDPLSEPLSLKILSPCGNTTSKDLLEHLINIPSTWTNAQLEDAHHLALDTGLATIDFSIFPSKANAASLTAALIKDQVDIQFSFSSPIDALRLIAILSGGDARISYHFKVASLKRSLRARIVRELDVFETSMLAEAFAQRRGTWKRVLMRLHPGDYRAPNLNAAYDLLYRNKAEAFEATLCKAIDAGDPLALKMAMQQPGIFARRLRHLYAHFGRDAFVKFLLIAPQLSTLQLERLDRVFATLPNRNTRLYAPKGRLAKATIVDAPKIDIPKVDISFLRESISEILQKRIADALPQGVKLGKDLDTIKLPMNGQELSPYGRGTRFSIPENINFIRSMSYWRVDDLSNIWFDNSWNFFHADWTPAGAVCWDTPGLGDKTAPAAVFSGDPASSQNEEGAGTQAIDLYLDQLANHKIRYAIWSTLCFSNLSFDSAREVFACLQWGEDMQKGDIFEPSRAQMAFPIRSSEMTNVTAMVDIETRELVYLDASLPLKLQSARENGKKLSETIPALLEVVNAQPSLEDVFSRAPKGIIPILRDDADGPVKDLALVACPLHPDSDITPVDLDRILSATG